CATAARLYKGIPMLRELTTLRRVCRVASLAAALLLIAGCTITSEGVQQYEVPIDEVFPPSKIVASYRQIKKPIKVEQKDVEDQLGGAQKFGVLKKWSPLSTLSAEYGIPDRPPKARVTVTEMGTKQ